MKKLFFSLLLLPSISSAYSLIFNPFTNKLDYVGVDTTTLTGNFIQNTPASSQSGSIDLSGKANSNNALINLTDTSNPFSSSTGYGLKIILNGHLGSPINAYGVYSSMPTTGIIGTRISGYFDSSSSGSGTNIGGRFNATGGTGVPYGILVDAGQVQVNSSMTVTQGILTSTFTAGNLTDTSSTVSYGVFQATGNAQAISVTEYGNASVIQDDNSGAVNIKQLGLGDALVIVSSYTDSQVGTSDILILDRSVNRNDPLIRIIRNSNNSAPDFRVDAPAPNMEQVATSTDNAHGRGKWEPYATPFQSEILQVNSRSWDNTTFENVAYWEPLSIQSSIATPGLFLRAQDLTNDSGVISSSNTAGVNFFTQNSHTVGITGPLNPTASWRFRMPSTFNNAGQVMSQSDNGDSFGDRTLAFTTGGTGGNALRYTSTSAVPTWGVPVCTNATKATINATTPTYTGECYSCSDCTGTYLCISTGTVVGAFGTAASRTTACN